MKDSRKPRRSYKNTKPRVFIFFLILAIVFWILTKFSKEINGSSSVMLSYVSIPQEVILSEASSEKITFDISANGFKLLLFKLRRPEIPVSVSTYFEQGKDSITLSNEQLLGLIQRELGSDVVVRNLQPTSVQITFDQMISKKVAVMPMTDIVFREGFQAIDSAYAIPDSVSVRAPKSSIDSLGTVSTLPLEAQNVDNDLSETVRLDLPEREHVTWDPVQVKVALKVAEFVQKEVTVPIQLINVPSDVSVKLVPETVLLRMNLPINEFQEVTANDFSVVCDYSKRNRDENFMLPELLKKPDWLRNVEFEDKKIDFLIFK
ncbi:hypothetical protein [Altibacter sp. HG106]|uniref:hypothetical protein n=1 Tax=Altibacter sp. HG106 TaxID=3023937 RepID=UPI0023502137|nr:hypothetical protein [Altibacter sp. HG106]MDC7995580.1 hypothetical protein [Altibacter sp. HG106]